MAASASAAATVPVVDLASSRAATELDTACRAIGFFQVAGHGVPRELIDAALAASDAFFARPPEEKLASRPPCRT